MPKIKTGKKISPEIYCFTTPNDVTHDGWCKIGYTDSQEAWGRVYQESRTTDTKCDIAWHHRAMFDTSEGCRDPFTDKDFHKYLDMLGIERKDSVYEGKEKPEFYKLSTEEAEKLFFEFQRGTLDTLVKYKLRDEQAEAVEVMQNADETLLNAKPRFGKTLTVYDYIKQVKAKQVLILTNRPVVATSWYNDYIKFLGTDDYVFVSNCFAVKDNKYCMSRDEYVSTLHTDSEKTLIEFVSLQDLKGSAYFGGTIQKLREVYELSWDAVVVDESHEAVDTTKTQFALDRIKRDKTIYLSGTPFKAIANERFNNVFNWTYVDEQEKKKPDEVDNVYNDMPKLNLFTYRLTDMFPDDDRMNEEVDRDRYYDLNKFFKTQGNNFVYDKEVDIFLDMISSADKYPFSSLESREEIKHSLWLMDRVSSAKALAAKLKNHPIFKEYCINLVAGDGKYDDEDEMTEKDFQSAFDKTTAAIKTHDKTITISVGRLTTGVTIPEWSAIMMLCNVTSPQLYVQAIFRAQNPGYIKGDLDNYIKKENAYVFDFDPARTLDILEQYANSLYVATANGKGTEEERTTNIEKLLKYLPVAGENDDGELISLSANDVITIPAKTHALEIVNHGFMSNFLFMNIGTIFRDAKALAILDQIKDIRSTRVKDDKLIQSTSYDETGNPTVKKDVADKLKKDISDEVKTNLTDSKEAAETIKAIIDTPINPSEKLKIMDSPKPVEQIKSENQEIDAFVSERTSKMTQVFVDAIKKTNDPDIQIKKVQKVIEDTYKRDVAQIKMDFDTNCNIIRAESSKHKHEVPAMEKINVVNAYANRIDHEVLVLESRMEELEDKFKDPDGLILDIIQDAKLVQQEKTNKKAENDWVLPKLKSFARAIPSFLMAYNITDCTTLSNVVNAKEFEELTGIKVEDYQYFVDNNFFNTVTFNKAIQEFYELRDRLSNYFDESATEDMFDYIPPQKTNQIFTPKKVVKQMADFLEENNPGCFDNPDFTFLDPYMKSGLFVTEVVKRLYRSPKIKEAFPDDTERLKHIFQKQVYGLAPTEIIHRIATNFIFGFDKENKYSTYRYHFIHLDAVPYTKDGTLEQKLSEYWRYDGTPRRVNI